jgi:glyoxylase-like metal-dependent hydrolase (beta-lactamase superfamily II)
MSELRYDTLVLRRQGLTRDVPPGDNEDLRWVANSATLIYGDQDAVLVDTFMTIEENARLIDWIRSQRRNLTHIFLTHGHGDHVYGIGQLQEAFPTAQAVATAGTVAEARREAGDEYRVGFFGRLFPDQIPPPAIPTELSGDTIALEEHQLRVIDTGHTDTTSTSVLWCPSLRLLVAGDVVYNRTHMYLGESTAASRREWIAMLTKLKDLDPLHVVAGHKQPDGTDDPSDIDESIQYLTDFNDAEARTTTPTELYQAVLQKHPRRANPGSAWGAAKMAKGTWPASRSAASHSPH